MVEQIVSWCGSVLIVSNISYVIYLNIVRIISRWKCRKKQYSMPFKPCHESECKFSEYCQHYEHVYTAEEIESIKNLIEKMKS